MTFEFVTLVLTFLVLVYAPVYSIYLLIEETATTRDRVARDFNEDISLDQPPLPPITGETPEERGRSVDDFLSAQLKQANERLIAREIKAGRIDTRSGLRKIMDGLYGISIVVYLGTIVVALLSTLFSYLSELTALYLSLDLRDLTSYDWVIYILIALYAIPIGCLLYLYSKDNYIKGYTQGWHDAKNKWSPEFRE